MARKANDTNGSQTGQPKSGRPRRGKKNAEAPATPTPQPGTAAGTTQGANTAIRGDIQRKAFERLWDCDRAIASETAKHIAPLREERNQIWKDLRNDLDAKAADLRPLYAVYKRDREVSEIDDADEAAKSADMLREGFKTLGTGNTLNFLDVLGGQLFGKEGEAREAKSGGGDPNETTAYQNGFAAGNDGLAATHNPHQEGTQDAEDWHQGWINGQTKKVHETLGAGAPAEQAA